MRDRIKRIIKESLNWSDKDNSFNSDPNWGTDNYYGPDAGWKPDTNWVQGSSSSASSDGDTTGAEEPMSEEEDILNSQDDFDWIRNTEEFPNYKGFPQGVVMVDSHQDIDTLRELLEKINPKGFKGRGEWHHLHQALEDKRDELEYEGYEVNDAVISISFFVERDLRGGLSFGYWGYEVDDNNINDWLDEDETYNREYRLYRSVYDLEKDLKNLTI